MGLFEIMIPSKNFTRLATAAFFFILMNFCLFVWADPYSSQGQILFSIRQGDHKRAFDLYQAYYKKQGHHDFELIHQMGLGLLDDGFRHNDPEIQLLTLYGATVSANEDAYYILEQSSRSRYPQIQLIALSALAKYNQDKADAIFIRTLGSPEFALRLAAVHQLCAKKHPQAVSQTESLMYKTPKNLLAIYPQFFAMVGNDQAMRILRRLLNDSSNEVRIEVILNLANYGRDDLLPQIRQQAAHLNFAQQEASAYALGVLKDKQSLNKLNRLTDSQYPYVRLAAMQALYRLGQKNVVKRIAEEATRLDLFAIAILGEMPEGALVLKSLLKNDHLQVRLNAALALLALKDASCVPHLQDLLIHDKRDLVFIENFSPGEALKSWKIVSSASQILKKNIEAYVTHLELRETVLSQVKNFSEKNFLQLAHLIFKAQQNDLVPAVIDLIDGSEGVEVVKFLNEYQQTPGAPLIRNYCNLALYRLGESGPYGDLLRKWVKSQNGKELIRFRPFVPWEHHLKNYELTPEETSQLLIQSFQVFAQQQDIEGIDALIEAIHNGHVKNKYALAGLLLRATE